MYKLFLLDGNTWNHITVYKQTIIIIINFFFYLKLHETI